MPARDPNTSPFHRATPSSNTHTHGLVQPGVISPLSSTFSDRDRRSHFFPSSLGKGLGSDGMGSMGTGSGAGGGGVGGGGGGAAARLRRFSTASSGRDREGIRDRDRSRDGERGGGTPVDSTMWGEERGPENGTGAGSSRYGSINRRYSRGDHTEPRPESSSAASIHQRPSISLLSSSHAIRDSTNRLASLSFTNPRRPSSSSAERPDAESWQRVAAAAVGSGSGPGVKRKASTDEAAFHGAITEEVSPPLSGPSSFNQRGKSGLSVMMERASTSPSPNSQSLAASPLKAHSATVTVQPIPEVPPTMHSGHVGNLGRSSDSETPGADGDDGEAEDDQVSSGLRRFLASEIHPADLERGDGSRSERTPLLRNDPSTPKISPTSPTSDSWTRRVSKLSLRQIGTAAVVEPFKLLPATILGMLLNVLDGVSYGMILFPASPVFPDFGSLGVSMFFMSCIVSQLTFSLGGSIFAGGNGSMMIEAVPFFHILVQTISQYCGDDAHSIIATTMVSFAFSSILTGLVFFGLGAFRLGTLIGYFPRHILVGCIGGVGIFLLETGLEVARGLKEEGFAYNLATLELFFESGHAIALWTIPLGLAILLRVITHFSKHQLIFPAYFFIIPLIFYVVVAIGKWPLDELRRGNWVFDVGQNTQAWWKFYTLFDFKRTNWEAFWAALPTQLALVFFGILHVPLNVPALGVSLSEDNVKLDRELVAHGVSNMAAGLVGTVPNYLCYVNTVLFYRVGGGSRLSGLMLAAGTAIIMAVGPSVIGYLPVMVVGALIFVLGIDLTLEAVWDTRNRVNRTEYITIWAIAIGMTLWDFVIGLLFGIILACFFFVVQNSRRKAIRAVFSGSTAKSTVRRPKAQMEFIQEVGTQTCVLKLQGFLFFGTISAVEDEIRKMLDMAKWQQNPIRFVVLDLTMVYGLDFSSAEAFVRVQRLLAAKDVLLILCGAAEHGVVGQALQAVGLWSTSDEGLVRTFEGLNAALEWTENAYLTVFYSNQKEAEAEPDAVRRIDYPKVDRPPFSLAESFTNSPRRSHLAKAGVSKLPRAFGESGSTLLSAEPPRPSSDTGHSAATPSHPAPYDLLVFTFSPYSSPSSEPPNFYTQLLPYFTRQALSSGSVLWHQGDAANALYLIQEGSLRATYAYSNHTRLVMETMVAGTIAGDLSMLSETKRNATVVAERECVVWKLDQGALDRLQKEKVEVGRAFTKIVLKAVAEEQNVLSSHLIAVLS